MTVRRRPNIVFLVLDTCRADTFYALLDEGYLSGVETLLPEARLYRNARAVAPWTVPSHGSLFSGLYPTDHGTSAGDPYFNPPTTPLAERLRLEGYETVGLSANPWITPNFDFTTGFERFKTESELFWGGTDQSGIENLNTNRGQIVELLNRTSLASAPKTVANAIYAKLLAHRRDDGAKRLTTDAIQWVTDRSSKRPFFLFCNYTEPHLKYDPPTKLMQEELPETVTAETAHAVNQDQWAYVSGTVDMSDQDFEVLRALYRAEIRYLDAQLARLFQRLSANGILSDTVVILVSDHGENVGEHGLMDHQYCLYETLLHVPLVIRYPPLVKPGETNALVETHRLYETVAELAGIENCQDGVAPSLVGTDGGSEYAIAEYTAPQPSIETLEEEYGPLDDTVWRYDRALRTIHRENGWKYIEGSDGSVQLYNLSADPDESTPIKNQTIQAELRNILEARRGKITRSGTQSADIDAPNKQQLENLGYL